MERINDLVLWLFGILIAGASCVFNRIFQRIDFAHKRIDRIESETVDRKYLESQLSPIRSDLSLILKHLLSEKK